jgi:hypothetical protein
MAQSSPCPRLSPVAAPGLFRSPPASLSILGCRSDPPAHHARAARSTPAEMACGSSLMLPVDLLGLAHRGGPRHPVSRRARSVLAGVIAAPAPCPGVARVHLAVPSPLPSTIRPPLEPSARPLPWREPHPSLPARRCRVPGSAPGSRPTARLLRSRSPQLADPPLRSRQNHPADPPPLPAPSPVLQTPRPDAPAPPPASPPVDARARRTLPPPNPNRRAAAPSTAASPPPRHLPHDSPPPVPNDPSNAPPLSQRCEPRPPPDAPTPPASPPPLPLPSEDRPSPPSVLSPTLRALQAAAGWPTAVPVLLRADE